MSNTVQLLITCLIDTLQPQIGESVVNVLRKAGAEVEFPDKQTCCGQPAYNAGLRLEAIKMAKHTIGVFENTSGDIVIPSGSCTAMIRHGYLELFKHDPSWHHRAITLSNRTFEFSEYLVDILNITDLDTNLSAKIAYHPSCHLTHGLGVNNQPQKLLSEIKGATITELPHAEDCCGFGGLFSIEHPEISAAMLERKIKNITSSAADWIATCDTGCLLHINGGLHRKKLPPIVLHIAEILDDSND